MSKYLTTRAELQLSVDEALRKIAQLSKELKQLKEDASKAISVDIQVDASKIAAQLSKAKAAVNTAPINLDVQVDTTKLDKQMSQIKTVLGGGRNRNGQFSTISSDIRGIREELTKLSKVLTTVVGEVDVASKEAEKFSDTMKKGVDGNTQMVTGLVNNVRQINYVFRQASKEAEGFKHNALGAFAAGLPSASSFISRINNAFGSVRTFGVGFLTTLGSVANKAMETVGFSVTGMVDEAMEQERKLQQSRIGFANMFPGQNVDSMVSQIRATAAKSPGLDSGNLASYINQLGAVSNGDYNTAYNATMGILKTVQYGGGDAASQMNYIIKNIRDVMAKGKATQVDIQQFNRAMPMLQKAMAAIGASEFLKNGELKITKDNAPKLMQAFAALNSEESPAYNIFDKTAKTLVGIQEEFREATASSIAEGLEGIGFYDALADMMRSSVLPELEGDIDSFFTWIGKIAKDIDWSTLKGEVGAVVKEVKTLIGELAGVLKDEFLNTDSLKFIIQIIGQFMKGLIGGAKEAAAFVADIRKRMGDEAFLNLAEALGAAVTQGWLFQKVIAGIAGAFGTAAHVAQGMFFLSQNTNMLGKKSGTLGSRIKPAWSVGGGATTVKGTIGKTVKNGLLGGSIIGLSDMFSEVTRQMKLFGDASENVADILKVSGAAIGGAVMGRILGPLGALGGALAGAVVAINQMQYAKNMEDAEAAGVVAKEIKDEKGKEMVEQAITVLRSVKDANGNQMFTFDEGTDAAVWAKNQVIELLENTDAKDWTPELAYNRLVRAYAQKLGQEFMSKADNQYGFWDLQGKELDFIGKNATGENVITEDGQRLVKMIRAYNLVGADSVEKLNAMSDQSLINQYLQSEKLNEAQLAFLEQQAAQFEETTGAAITGTAEDIANTIALHGGNLDNAITSAYEAGEDAFAKTLEAYRALGDLATKTKKEMLGTAADNPWWDEDTAKEFLGEKGAENYMKWVNRGGGDWWNDNVSDSNAQFFAEVFDTEGNGPTTGPAVVIKNLYEEMTKLRESATDASRSEEDRAKDTAAAEAIKSFIDRNSDNYGDWESFAPSAISLAQTLLSYGRGQNLFNNTISVPTEYGYKLVRPDDDSEKTAVALSEWLEEYMKKHGIGGTGRANGGLIRPIFRANGGGTGRGVDVVPAYLQPGEFIQRKTAVETAGVGVMQALNNGDLAQAYKLIGSKINGSWNNSRNDYSSRDNRRYQNNNFFIRNTNRAGRIGTQASLANFIALGY